MTQYRFHSRGGWQKKKLNHLRGSPDTNLMILSKMKLAHLQGKRKNARQAYRSTGKPKIQLGMIQAPERVLMTTDLHLHTKNALQDNIKEIHRYNQKKNVYRLSISYVLCRCRGPIVRRLLGFGESADACDRERIAKSTRPIGI